APFSLMAEALRSRLRGHALPPAGAPFDQGLRLILPEWDAAPGPATQLDASQLQLLALEGLVRVMRDVAGAGPGALLVLDDVHAADADSLDGLRYVASARIDGLAIVAALRPGESALADDLVRAIRGDEAQTVVPLEPLPPRAVGDLISNLL